MYQWFLVCTYFCLQKGATYIDVKIELIKQLDIQQQVILTH